MNPVPHATSDASSTSLGRRRFLGILGLGAAGVGAASAGLLGRDRTAAQINEPGGLAGAEAASPGRDSVVLAPAQSTQLERGRTLVVIDLEGGNDGLSTVIPINDPRYGDLRRNTGYVDDDPFMIDEGLALNPGLAGLHERGLRIVHGVGTREPDLSHFAMAERWAKGSTTGTDRLHTGFLGRCCDALAGDEVVTGLSVGAAYGLTMVTDHALTMPVAGGDGLQTMTRRDLWASEFRDGLRLLSGHASGQERTPSQHGLHRAIEFARALGPLESGDESDERPGWNAGYPETDLGQRLAFAGHVIKTGVGVRVLHVPFSGFDTHEGHRWRHDELMTELGTSVSAFLDDLSAAGRSDDVLVATTSEFGRRPAENGYGTDHGAGSVALLAGAVTPGHLGEPSPLDRFDRDDNLIATVDMGDYYATIAADWLGLDPAQVLPGSPTPLSASGIRA